MVTFNSAPATWTETLNTNPGWDGWWMEWPEPKPSSE